jgi:hypothetical protein
MTHVALKRNKRRTRANRNVVVEEHSKFEVTIFDQTSCSTRSHRTAPLRVTELLFNEPYTNMDVKLQSQVRIYQQCSLISARCPQKLVAGDLTRRKNFMLAFVKAIASFGAPANRIEQRAMRAAKALGLETATTVSAIGSGLVMVGFSDIDGKTQSESHMLKITADLQQRNLDLTDKIADRLTFGNFDFVCPNCRSSTVMKRVSLVAAVEMKDWEVRDLRGVDCITTVIGSIRHRVGSRSRSGVARTSAHSRPTAALVPSVSGHRKYVIVVCNAVLLVRWKFHRRHHCGWSWWLRHVLRLHC